MAQRLIRPLREIAADIWWGLRSIAPFVMFFGGLSVVAELLGVRFPGLDLRRTVFVYVAFGSFAGIVLGTLRPVAASTVGAAVIGGMVGLPLGAYEIILATGRISPDVFTAIFLAVFAGISAWCATGFWRGYSRAKQRAAASGVETVDSQKPGSDLA